METIVIVVIVKIDALRDFGFRHLSYRNFPLAVRSPFITLNFLQRRRNVRGRSALKENKTVISLVSYSVPTPTAPSQDAGICPSWVTMQEGRSPILRTICRREGEARLASSTVAKTGGVQEATLVPYKTHP